MSLLQGTTAYDRDRSSADAKHNSLSHPLTRGTTTVCLPDVATFWLLVTYRVHVSDI